MTVASIVAIIVYFAFCLTVGLGLGFKKEVVSTGRGYFLGGGTAKFVLFFTTLATWFSTGIYMGVIGTVYKNGVGTQAWAAWQVLVVGLMGVFGPRFWKLSNVRGYVTPADLVSDYFQSKAFKVIMGIGMMAFCLPSMIAQIKGVSWAIDGITGGTVPFQAAILVSSIVVGIYVFFGGFRSQAWVDTAQGILFIVVLWVSLIVIAARSGGWTTVWQRLNETAPGLLYYKHPPEYWNWRMCLSFFILQGCGGFLAPYVWQRSYAAKSGRDILKITGGQMAAVFCFGIVFPVAFAGLNMHVLYPQMANPENGLVIFMAQHAPAVGILITLGILAAGMSTISSILVTISSIAVVDFIGLAKPNLTPQQTRNYGRYGVLVLLVIGVGLSFINMRTIEILINLTLAGFTQILIPLLGIFVFRRMTKAGAVSGYLAGLIITYLGTIHWNNPFSLMGGIWGLAANLLICVIVSAFTKPVSAEHREWYLRPVSKPDVRLASAKK